MKTIFASITLLLIAAGCKEKYLPSIISPSAGYLVVEGFINSGAEPTYITLTRSTRLYDSVDIVNEHNALINIEGENNDIFPLYENGNGVYISGSPLHLANNKKYRLRIKTRDNKEYVSDFTPVKYTPAIDSITWKRENGGLRIYINTHDPQNNTRYYKWNYEETWEIHSEYLTSLKYVNDPITGIPASVDYRDPRTGAYDPLLYLCWRSSISRKINLGTSEKLSSDLIYLPLLSIEPASEKLGVLYSINVKQCALSKEAYLFFEKIKKNTEQLGSIFDPQPTELKGNIHCLTNPAEQVVGYVDISEEKQQRIFISNAEVPGWNFKRPCSETLIDNQPDSIKKYGLTLVPTMPFQVFRSFIVNFHASSPFCVDCTTLGTNIKPSFWP